MAADTFIVCEGPDDEYTLRALVSEGLTPRVRFLCARGQDQFRELLVKLPQMTEVSSGEVRTIAVVRDAEQKLGASFQSTVEALRKGGFPNVPAQSGEIAQGQPNLAVFIVGKADGTGMLEDVFLASVEDRPDFPCLEEYVECARTEGKREPKNLSKAKLRAWLAMESEWDLGAGKAVDKGFIDVKHSAFDGIREFLRAVEAA
jgi:hypothetical protein